MSFVSSRVVRAARSAQRTQRSIQKPWLHALSHVYDSWEVLLSMHTCKMATNTAAATMLAGMATTTISKVSTTPSANLGAGGDDDCGGNGDACSNIWLLAGERSACVGKRPRCAPNQQKLIRDVVDVLARQGASHGVCNDTDDAATVDGGSKDTDDNDDNDDGA